MQRDSGLARCQDRPRRRHLPIRTQGCAPSLQHFPLLTRLPLRIHEASTSVPFPGPTTHTQTKDDFVAKYFIAWFPWWTTGEGWSWIITASSEIA